MPTSIRVIVNGQPYEVSIDIRMTLVDLLREKLALTGTHVGCRTGNCGACTVRLAGLTVKSCCILAADVDGQEILTIEGLSSSPEQLHPVQTALVKNHGLQCGFCTPGLVLSALQLLTSNADPEDAEVRRAIAGNLCRCTGYQNVMTSILEAAKVLRQNQSGGGEHQPSPTKTEAGTETLS